MTMTMMNDDDDDDDIDKDDCYGDDDGSPAFSTFNPIHR